MTELPCNSDFPIGTVDTAECPADSLLVEDQEMCKFAASVTNADIDEQRFLLNKEWFPYHPHGCFAFPCSSDVSSSSKMCYYFNPGEDPCDNPKNETHKCTGVPICHTPHYLQGKVDGNFGCKTAKGDDPEGEFEVIVDEEECKGASNCLGYCRNQQFRVQEETNICSYSQKQCETMAGSLGLTLGDTANGVAFVGEHNTTGCYTYGRGVNMGKAFYGTKNSIEPVSEVDLTEPNFEAGEYRVKGTYECLTGLTELKGMGTDANYGAPVTVKSIPGKPAKQACADLVPEGGGYYYKNNTCRPIAKGSVQALRAEFATAPFTVTDADATYLPAAPVRKAFPGQGNQGNSSVYEDAGAAGTREECAAKAPEGGAYYYDATSCKVVSAANTEKLRAQLKTIDWSGPNCAAAGAAATAASGNASTGNASMLDMDAMPPLKPLDYPGCSTWLPTVPHANQSIHNKYPEGCFIEENLEGGCVRYNPPSLNFGLPKFPVGTPVCVSHTPGHMWPDLAEGIAVDANYGLANNQTHETAA